jgi:NAD(P)H-hydrate repair Nnr-like enzyme with NAD(P)H-hydrate epimerase domain
MIIDTNNNNSKIPVFSLDISSGIDKDTTIVLWVIICVRVKVNFVKNKISFFIS